MRPLRRLLNLVVIVWTIVAAAAAVAIVGWVRERYGRGGPMPAAQAGMLLNPLRARVLSPQDAMAAFGVREGETVIELGPGPGYYSIEASRAVGETGRVICVDVQRGMIEILADRLREAGADRARPIVGDATCLPLAEASCDRAYLVTVFGEIPDRNAALYELRRILKPGSVLAFTELLGDPDYVLMAWLEDLCAAYGFERIKETGMLLGYTATFAAPKGRRRRARP